MNLQLQQLLVDLQRGVRAEMSRRCLDCIKKKKKDPWTPARFKRAGLGPVLVLEYVVLGPARPVSFTPGSGPVPSKLGPARPVPTPS